MSADAAPTSSFGSALKELVERVPGAIGAVFTDWEGEPVDQYAHVSAYEIQVMGAHFGLVLSLANEGLGGQGLGAVDEIVIECDRALIFVRMVNDRYCVVLAGNKGLHLATAERELGRGVASLRAEL